MATQAAAPANSAEITAPLTIGVLALQGDYEAHARAFKSSGARTVLVRKAEELAGLDGLGDSRRRINDHAQVPRERWIP